MSVDERLTPVEWIKDGTVAERMERHDDLPLGTMTPASTGGSQ